MPCLDTSFCDICWPVILWAEGVLTRLTVGGGGGGASLPLLLETRTKNLSLWEASTLSTHFSLLGDGRTQHGCPKSSGKQTGWMPSPTKNSDSPDVVLWQKKQLNIHPSPIFSDFPVEPGCQPISLETVLQGRDGPCMCVPGASSFRFSVSGVNQLGDNLHQGTLPAVQNVKSLHTGTSSGF